MRAILIDPLIEGGLVTDLEIPSFDDVRDLYKLLGCDNVTGAFGHFSNDDVVYVDGYGLVRPAPGPFFQIGQGQPLAGRGLVVGTSRSGRAISARTKLDEARRLVSFPNIELEGFEPYGDGHFVIGSRAIFREKK